MQKVAKDESEFGGVGGLFPEQNVAAPRHSQELQRLYATNESGDDGSETEDVARARIGYPKTSYSPGAGH